MIGVLERLAAEVVERAGAVRLGAVADEGIALAGEIAHIAGRVRVEEVGEGEIVPVDLVFRRLPAGRLDGLEGAVGGLERRAAVCVVADEDGAVIAEVRVQRHRVGNREAVVHRVAHDLAAVGKIPSDRPAEEGAALGRIGGSRDGRADRERGVRRGEGERAVGLVAGEGDGDHGGRLRPAAGDERSVKKPVPLRNPLPPRAEKRDGLRVGYGIGYGVGSGVGHGIGRRVGNDVDVAVRVRVTGGENRRGERKAAEQNQRGKADQNGRAFVLQGAVSSFADAAKYAFRSAASRSVYAARSGAAMW